MKKIIICLISAVVAFASADAKTWKIKTDKKKDKAKTEAQVFKTTLDSVSYAVGMGIGYNIKPQLQQLLDNKQDNKILVEAFLAVINGDSTLLNPITADSLTQTYISREMKRKADEWKAKNIAFLAQNAKNNGVISTDSTGMLQYKVIREGEGKKPTATSTVKVHYEGKLIDGTVFDSSYKRNEPIEFALNQVIKGWTDGLQLMREGGKYELFVPQELGYGERPNANIPGFSTLIFTIELLEVK